jgi:hypothetical protein
LPFCCLIAFAVVAVFENVQTFRKLFGFELPIFCKRLLLFLVTGMDNLLSNFRWSKMPFISIEQHKGRDTHMLLTSVSSTQSAKRATDWSVLKSGIASAKLGSLGVIR